MLVWFFFKFCVNTEERYKIKIGCRCVGCKLTHLNLIIAKKYGDVKGGVAVHFTLDRDGDFRYSGRRSAK